MKDSKPGTGIESLYPTLAGILEDVSLHRISGRSHIAGLAGQDSGQKPSLERGCVVREHRFLLRGERHHADEARGPRCPGPR